MCKYFNCCGICYCAILDAVVSHENVQKPLGNGQPRKLNPKDIRVLKTAWKITLISTPDGGCLLLLGVAIDWQVMSC